MYKVLMVEDQKEVRKFVIEYFHARDIQIIEAWNGYEALKLLDSNIDLVLLDIMMPGIDGYEVCQQIRTQSNVPIIFISALSEDDNQLQAYELGADDYITKPFKASLLYAKTKALIKRSQGQIEEPIQLGRIQINHQKHEIMIEQQSILLTAKEYKLLQYLLQNQNKAIPREKILNDIWGYDYFGDARAVDTYIKRLRKRFGPYAYYIKTLTRVGYMLEVKENEDC